MLRVIVNNSASAAKAYYAQGLSKNDYYTQEKDTEIIGSWGGYGCELLNLKGTVTQEQFNKLCDNLHPITGEQLTQRTNDNRRVGYDLNFHAPKSVSIIYAITKDEQILTAFREAVKETMLQIEKDMQARVRKGGRNENRETGNLVYGEFIHTTTRPVDGIPDPHLHAHCFTFNATFDKAEQQWKAGEFGKIKKDAGYFEAYFHSSLSGRIKDMGYGIQANRKGWEIAGIERTTIEKFSRRTTEIEKLAKEKGITSAKEKDQLGAKTRKGKEKNLSGNELTQTWLSNLSDKEKTAVFEAKDSAKVDKAATQPARHIELAVEHILERKSVTTERELLRDALKRSVGDCKPAEIIKAYSSEKLIKAKGKDEVLLTTKEAVNEERQLIQLATEGKGKFAPLDKGYQIQNKELNKEQQDAVKHVLSSKDQVKIIEGGAGTGKTTLMKELKTAIQKTGKPFLPLAPSADASRGVLQSEGFNGADTVAQFLLNKKMQEQVRNGVIWVDEATLLGNKTANSILAIAKQQKAHVIFTGDTNQHNSVERGDAFRNMIEKSKIKPARVDEIQRQRANPNYKAVVRHISKGSLDKAFSGLEGIDAIQQIQDAKERFAAVAGDFVQTIKAKQSVIVVAPTHAEGDNVTREIRDRLKEEKLLGKQERAFTIQKNLSPTEAEKKTAGFYQPGMAVQFHQNAKGFSRGAIYNVAGVDDKGKVFVTNGREMKELPLKEGKRFSVYEAQEVQFAKGEVGRITQNGFSLNKKRLNNGDMFKIRGFDTEGNIIAAKGKQEIILDKDYRNYTYGYCTTSHASQGKTVDKVIISQSSMSSRAASKEQFYVSVSRGKTAISIYTDDKTELRSAVTSSSQRMSATEVLEKSKPKRNVQQALVSRLAELSRAWQQRSISITRSIPRK